MIGKIKLLTNYEELNAYEDAIEQYGQEEALMLGK